MQVTCSITLGQDDLLPAGEDHQAIADAVLVACGGDPSRDVCWLSFAPLTVTAGTLPAPPGVPIGGGSPDEEAPA